MLQWVPSRLEAFHNVAQEVHHITADVGHVAWWVQPCTKCQRTMWEIVPRSFLGCFRWAQMSSHTCKGKVEDMGDASDLLLQQLGLHFLWHGLYDMLSVTKPIYHVKTASCAHLLVSEVQRDEEGTRCQVGNRAPADSNDVPVLLGLQRLQHGTALHGSEATGGCTCA